MKLTITDLMMILDTINGSLSIDDRGNFMFHYNKEYREDMSFKIQKYLASINVNVEIEEKENIGN